MTRQAVVRLAWWALVALWFVVVWWFGESQLFPLSQPPALTRWLLRKTLHVAVYAVLSALLALASGARSRVGWVIGVCLLVAVGDELHQLTVPRRTFQIHDLGIDLVGTLLGVAVCRSVAGRADDVANSRGFWGR